MKTSRHGRARRRRIGAILAAVVLVAAMGTVAFGQFRNQSSASARHNATKDDFDGRFQFCRIEFRSASNGDGGPWSVDFPRADQNLSVRLSELTKAPVSFNDRMEPNHLLLSLDQPEIFRCGFMMMTEVGALYLDDEEARNLRNYLLKGGFLWADDFWGERAWGIWESQIRKALPSNAFPIVDLSLDHPFFNQVLHVDHFPQIPALNATNWRAGQTSERGAESATPHARAIYDHPGGRVMVLITHNTDFGDAYEREEDDPEYFRVFSVIGYAFGINVLVYAMTH